MFIMHFQSENLDCDNNPVVVQVEPDEEHTYKDEHTKDETAEAITTSFPEPSSLPGEFFSNNIINLTCWYYTSAYLRHFLTG